MARVVVSILAALSMAVAPSTAWAAWSQPSGGPLDVVPGSLAFSSSIANVGGVPYVAWSEASAGDFQIFVKRLEGTGGHLLAFVARLEPGGWVPIGGALNESTSENADSPKLGDVDGVPYVSYVDSQVARTTFIIQRATTGRRARGR